MSNMSYCRFENTSRDLSDCYEHLEDEDLSDSEKRCKENLIGQCVEILESLEYEVNGPENDEE